MKSPLQSTQTAIGQGIKCTVHGAAGVGKTYLLSTAPRPVILSAENGLLSLRRFNIPFYRIASLADLRAARQWISTAQEARQFQTIGVDSVTAIADTILREFKAKTKDGRAAYGDVQDELALFMRNLRDLPGPNVVFNFESEFYKDEALGTAVHLPSVPGQNLKGRIAYLTDEVFYMFTATGQDGKPIRALRTQPDFRTVAKDRSGSLADVEPPDLTAIFTKIAKG